VDKSQGIFSNSRVFDTDDSVNKVGDCEWH
jgi:hypothetical protein